MAWLLAGVARSEPLEGVTVRQKRGASVSARGAAGRGAGGGSEWGGRRPSRSSAPTFLPTPLPRVAGGAGEETRGPLGFCHSAARGRGEDGSPLLCLSFHTCTTATGTAHPLCGSIPGLDPSENVTSSETTTVTASC